MDIEEPVACGYVPAFDFHAALPGMLSPTLIGDQVVQVREPRQKRLLIAAWIDLLSASLLTPVASRNLLLYQSLPYQSSRIDMPF